MIPDAGPGRRATLSIAYIVLVFVLLVIALPRACRYRSTDIPRVEADDLTFETSFSVPTSGAMNGPTDLSEGGQALSLAPDGGLYFGCHSPLMFAKVSIAAPGAPSQLLEPCRYVPEAPGDGSHLGGLLTLGDRLVASKFVFYDGNGAAWWSHQHSLDGGVTWSPLEKVGTDAGPNGQPLNAGFYAGYMGAVPATWAEAFGAPAFTGQGILSIISRTSSGPAAFGFDPAHLGLAYPVQTQPWVYYPLDHPLANPDTQNEWFSRADQLGGAFFVPGSRSLLFVGMHGMGVPCYGSGTANQADAGTVGPDGMMRCYDPLNGSQGEHVYPYRGQVWAYDVDDLLAVRHGDRAPWDVKPYAVWALPGVSQEAYRVRRGGVAFNPATGALYVTETFGTAPRVDVFRLRGLAPAPPAGVTYRCTMELTGVSPSLLAGPARCEPVSR